MERPYCPACEARQGAASLFTALEDRREKLKTIRAPTVVLHGAEDLLVPVEAGRDTAANIHGAQLTIIPGIGHDMPLAVVKTVVDAIGGFTSRPRTAVPVSSRSSRTP